MSSSQDSQYRTLKARKTAAAHPPALATQGHSGPTTFFLRSEKEVEKSTQRGRKQSRGSPTAEEEDMQKTPMESAMGDSGFGVESLADTIRSTSSSSDAGLSRTDSNASEPSVEAGADGSNVLAGRKRKAGNPVHPKILATGQRIISAEYASTGSPTSLRSAESPIRTHLRRASTSSSINLSQPLTPLKMSPQPESAMPSTPRSGSPKSFRLSDEEASLADETHSQAIQSSSGEEDGEEEGGSPSAGAMPQLVMPSISMPTRRPFTQRGKQMGRLKVMVVGARGVGKTSLIQSICRVCEDVVHMDPITGHIRDHPEPVRSTTANGETKQIVEIGASTREYPPWWTDFETRRQLLRRKSIGEGVLERNLTFVDTPGFHDGCHVSEVLQHFKALMARIGNMEKMHDIELISMLSGEGGVQVDAVLYVFDSATSSTESPTQLQLDSAQAELLRYLCKWTNVIPLIGRADLVEADELVARKRQIMEIFKTLPAEPCVARNMDGANNEPSASATEPQEPLTISSALGDDPETIEASVLMSSGYLQPLLPSELNVFVEGLLEPENVARLRHLSATKFLLWRQENLGFQLGLQNQLLLKSPCFESESPAETSTGSIAEEPSKVLVPHGSSSYFRSTSPSASESSAISGNVMGTSSYALARYNDQTNTNVPFRQVRLAKWAQDLQRSLDNERRRYKQMYVDATSDWTSNSAAECSEKPDLSQSLVTTSGTRPAKGRLGGDLGIIDPRDPLGVLAFGEAFRRRGWFALQIAGGCGLIGAVAWWVVRNWVEVQEWVGFGQPVAFGVTAVPAPTTRGWLQWER